MPFHQACPNLRIDELLPPSLDGYGVSFVLHRGETSTAPLLGRFPPGAGFTGQSHFKPQQQNQSRIFIAATGETAMRALVFPVRERFFLVRQFPARMTALRWLNLPRRRLLAASLWILMCLAPMTGLVWSDGHFRGLIRH